MECQREQYPSTEHANVYLNANTEDSHNKHYPDCQIVFPPIETEEDKQAVLEYLEGRVQVTKNKFGERLPTIPDQEFVVYAGKTGHHNEHRGNACIQVLGAFKTLKEALAHAHLVQAIGKFNIKAMTPVIARTGETHYVRDTACRTPYTALVVDPASTNSGERESLEEIEKFNSTQRQVKDFYGFMKKQNENAKRTLLIKYAKAGMKNPNAQIERDLAAAIYDVPGNGSLPTRVRERMRASLAEESKRLTTINALCTDAVMPKDDDEFHFFCEYKRGDFYTSGRYQEYLSTP